MNTWYCVNTSPNSRITVRQVEVVKETAKTVVIIWDKKQRLSARQLKTSDDQSYFPDLQTAAAFALPKARARVSSAQIDLAFEKMALQEIVNFLAVDEIDFKTTAG